MGGQDERYADQWVTCTGDGLRVRGYYFPWGSKTIPYAAIRGLRRVDLSAARGRARVWGTANPRYWANLDPARPRKTTGLVLDLGRRVSPLLTPDDVDAVEAAIREHGALPESGSGRAPLI